MTQYIHGRTQIPEPIPAEKIKEQRELEQKQRAMERKIRKLKRFAEGTLDPDTAKEYRRKVRQAQQELKAVINANSEVLRRDYSREKVYGGLTEKEKDDKIELTTSNGIGVTKFSKHMEERASERKVSVNDIKDALINPLYIDEIKIDSLGRPSQRFIGEKATVNVNPQTGTIATIWKTGKNKINKYKRK